MYMTDYMTIISMRTEKHNGKHFDLKYHIFFLLSKFMCYLIKA